MSKKLNRRRFLQTSAALGGAAMTKQTVAAHAEHPVSATIGGRFSTPALIPAKKGPRVVVVGGGWSGLTMAKYLKKNNPKFDVVLLDKNEQFVSCPISNVWMADQVNLDFLTHSYVEAAHNNDYLFLNTTALELDRTSKTLITTLGSIKYDYLVLAPGIDYDYSRIGVDDPEDEYALRMHYPAGFSNHSEIMSIKHKLQRFEGGTFLLTVPAGNYRCMAAPYERACMAAAIFKRNNIRGKILLLDMNADVRIKADGFKHAFSEYYADIIQYEPNAAIEAVDARRREISTDFDSYTFDDAAIYPPVRAASIIEHFGLSDPKSPQKEAHIDPFKYHLMDDEFVYVTGDSRSQPFSKSGNTANSEARYVAEVISAHAEGKEIEWRSPQTMCFSGVR
ncbi:MAG TPA: twin-arginine translocation signal domain-containing protein, partial [Gammaproteobacteria bacterium]|nr:twin-arginine translocation signal domain-containing protein [Gammaproteobacteria bacterium]